MPVKKRTLPSDSIASPSVECFSRQPADEGQTQFFFCMVRALYLPSRESFISISDCQACPGALILQDDLWEGKQHIEAA